MVVYAILFVMKVFGTNRYLIVLLVTLFNVIAELSLRGVFEAFRSPLLIPWIFLNYFLYFLLMEDLIGRYKLNDLTAYVAAIFFGVTWMLIGPSIVFIPPLVAGINWIGFIFVNVVWWGLLQTIIPFYLANRIIFRDSEGPLFSNSMQKKIFIAFGIVTLLFRLGAITFPLPNILAIVIILPILYGLYKLFHKLVSQAPTISVPHVQNIFLDILSIAILFYLVYSIIFIAADKTDYIVAAQLNRHALRTNLVVTAVFFVIFWIYRLIFLKKSIKI